LIEGLASRKDEPPAAGKPLLASNDSYSVDEGPTNMAHETHPASSFSSPTVSRGYSSTPNAAAATANSYIAATRANPTIMASSTTDFAQPAIQGATGGIQSTGNPIATSAPQDGQPAKLAGAQPLVVPAIKRGLPLKRRPEEVRRIAIEVFPQCDSWVVFYREIMGVDGVARKLFNGVDQIRFWENSDEFAELQEMVAALRAQGNQKSDSVEPLRMITIRLPVSLHESLKVEATEHETSMNKLCMSKLLLSISPKLVPPEQGGIRGRKPGPQGKRNETR